MLSIIRGTTSELGVPVRVVRRDIISRCGPLGGVLTGLQRTRADAVLFLACDMPFVTGALLRRIHRASHRGADAAFAEQQGRIGFPFLLPQTALAQVEAQIAEQEFSVHALAAALRARRVAVGAKKNELLNVNTPEDAMLAAQLFGAKAKGRCPS
jgi:molybdenum cofactor guanylyltransferase